MYSIPMIGSLTSCNFCKSNLFCVKSCCFKQQDRINCMAQVSSILLLHGSNALFYRAPISFLKNSYLISVNVLQPMGLLCLKHTIH